MHGSPCQKSFQGGTASNEGALQMVHRIPLHTVRKHPARLPVLKYLLRLCRLGTGCHMGTCQDNIRLDCVLDNNGLWDTAEEKLLGVCRYDQEDKFYKIPNYALQEMS